MRIFSSAEYCLRVARADVLHDPLGGHFGGSGFLAHLHSLMATVRRVEMPKGPGKIGTRLLGFPTVADRLLQRAVARILEAVFETDSLDCSYGFRPGRNPHHALQAPRLHIVTKKVSHVFEADRHDAIKKQVGDINAVLRGHYAYYGIAGNIRALFKVYRAIERYWRKMLCSRSWAGRHLTWDAFNQIKERTPLSRPKLHLPYRALQSLAVL